MDKKIETFIEKQKNMTVCTSKNNIPYCANCFYTYINNGYYLVFKSKRKTAHISNAMLNKNIAGTIVPDIKMIGAIKGIQFTGKFIEPKDELLELAKQVYYSRHPIAMAIPGELWVIALTNVKMTDNTLGFKGKLIWAKIHETEK